MNILLNCFVILSASLLSPKAISGLSPWKEPHNPIRALNSGDTLKFKHYTDSLKLRTSIRDQSSMPILTFKDFRSKTPIKHFPDFKSNMPVILFKDAKRLPEILISK